MNLTSRTILYNLHSSWTKATMLVVILCMYLPLIIGMPFFGDRNSLEKAYQNGALDELVSPDSSDVVDDFFEYDIPVGSYDKLESLFANRFVDDDAVNDEEDNETFGIMDNGPSIGTRAKRLGFSYFPYRLSRRFNLNRFKGRTIPEIIKAIRKEEYNPVKRRLAFTPLRGR